MYSSPIGIDILFEIYKDSRTVFRINDIALLINSNDRLLYQKLNKQTQIYKCFIFNRLGIVNK